MRQRSWLGGKLSRRTITVSNVMTKRKKITVCSFSGWNDREVIPGSTHKIESKHGIEKGKTPSACTGVDKRLNLNCGYKILLTYDPRSSTPQSPEGQWARLGSGIENQVDRLNRTPALQRAQGQERLHATHETPYPPPHPPLPHSRTTHAVPHQHRKTV